jgi:hypothetical protein
VLTPDFAEDFFFEVGRTDFGSGLPGIIREVPNAGQILVVESVQWQAYDYQ